MVLHVLDELRAAETFGGVVLALWADVSRDETLRAGLRTVGERDARHGRLLADRLQALGGRPERALPADLRESARALLGSATLPDAAKLRHVLQRLPDARAATAPYREVLEQIEDDRETRALLESMIEDETATAHWLLATAERLGVARLGGEA